MQEIPGVGVVRQRYPVMPIHEEGNTIYKELEALKDIVLEAKNFVYMLRDSDTDIFEKGFTLKMLPSTPEFGSHEHLIHLTGKEVQRLYSGILVKKVTNMVNGHQHEVIIQRGIVRSNSFYKIFQCDGLRICFDGHNVRLGAPL